MATISATCSKDGDVELTQNEIQIIKFTYNGEELSAAKYCFNCPICKKPQTKPANEAIQTVLIAAGSKTRYIEIGERMRDEEFNLEPVTADEIVALFEHGRSGQTVLEFGLERFLKDPLTFRRWIPDDSPNFDNAFEWYQAQAAIEDHISMTGNINQAIEKIDLLEIDSELKERVKTALRKPMNKPTIAFEFDRTTSAVDDSFIVEFDTVHDVETIIETSSANRNARTQIREVMENANIPSAKIESVLPATFARSL